MFAVKKFHYYIYGHQVKVCTYHKPLVGLLKRPISDVASSRLKRMSLFLVKYSLSLEYTPGKLMYIADLLSRSYLKENDGDESWLNEEIHSVTANLNISDSKKSEF